MSRVGSIAYPPFADDVIQLSVTRMGQRGAAEWDVEQTSWLRACTEAELIDRLLECWSASSFPIREWTNRVHRAGLWVPAPGSSANSSVQLVVEGDWPAGRIWQDVPMPARVIEKRMERLNPIAGRVLAELWSAAPGLEIGSVVLARPEDVQTPLASINESHARTVEWCVRADVAIVRCEDFAFEFAQSTLGDRRFILVDHAATPYVYIPERTECFDELELTLRDVAIAVMTEPEAVFEKCLNLRIPGGAVRQFYRAGDRARGEFATLPARTQFDVATRVLGELVPQEPTNPYWVAVEQALHACRRILHDGSSFSSEQMEQISAAIQPTECALHRADHPSLYPSLLGLYVARLTLVIGVPNHNVPYPHIPLKPGVKEFRPIHERVLSWIDRLKGHSGR